MDIAGHIKHQHIECKLWHWVATWGHACVRVRRLPIAVVPCLCTWCHSSITPIRLRLGMESNYVTWRKDYCCRISPLGRRCLSLLHIFWLLCPHLPIGVAALLFCSLLHYRVNKPWIIMYILMLDIRNVEQTKYVLCTLKNIYSSRCSHIAVHGWTG